MLTAIAAVLLAQTDEVERRYSVWVACAEAATATIAKADEPAETLADAVMGACVDQESQFRSAVYGEFTTNTSHRADVRYEFDRRSVRSAILARIVAARSAR